jgi:hypothetical protein
MLRGNAGEGEAMTKIFSDVALTGAPWRGLSGGAGLSCKSICGIFHYHLCYICTICRFSQEVASLVQTCPAPSLTTPNGDTP